MNSGKEILMNYNAADDTIAAISTALSPSGIGIIRVSGPDAIRIVDGIFESGKEKKNRRNDPDKTEFEENLPSAKTKNEGIENEEKLSSAKAQNEGILTSAKSHTIHYGKIVKDQIAYDEVLVSVMRAPNTYTREDVVEINCHGGPFVCRKVLELVLAEGARCAEPGEFTKRAFLNGRLKLTEAEAVMDVISAENDYALQNGVAQLSGSVQKEIRALREEILGEIAYIEAALDDPEHMSLDGYPEELAEKTEKILERMDKLLRRADDGRIMKEGIKTAIVGKPNVGKSSLLNALLGEKRAIVTDVAGTTRDTLEENIYFRGMTLHLIDTAGIRKTEDTVEKIGVRRAMEAVEQADLVLFVVDGSEQLTLEDLEIWKLVQEKKTILVKNKTDLSEKTENLYENDSYVLDESDSVDVSKYDQNEKNEGGEKKKAVETNFECAKIENSDEGNAEKKKKTVETDFEYMKTETSEQASAEKIIEESCRRRKIPAVEISAKTLEGMDSLEECVEKMFYMEEIRPNTQVYITNARQKEALMDAYESMKLVKQSIEDGMPEDFFSIDLTDSYEYLGKMIGETLEDDVAEQIFSKFCMGK